MSSVLSSLLRPPAGLVHRSGLVLAAVIMRARVLVTLMLVFVGATALGVAGSGPPAAATVSPIHVTCGGVNYASSLPPVVINLTSCTHHGITGGSGSFTQSTGSNPITETVAWANGKTSVATENVVQQTGSAVTCPSTFEGLSLEKQNKVKGTITGGTATSLIGSKLKRKTCIYVGNGTAAITLLPGTVAKY